MYIIVGLGNPGREFVNTRHNIGFDVLDVLADEENISVLEKKHKAIIGKGVVAGQKCILAKPVTFMNRSGGCVFEYAAFYKAESTDLWVIYDDIDLPAGIVRLRAKGGAGTHNGMRDIIARLGTEQFPRFRVGVGGPPPGWDLADYVLAKPRGEEAELFEQAIARAAEAAEYALKNGVEAAMRYNGSQPNPEK